MTEMERAAIEFGGKVILPPGIMRKLALVVGDELLCGVKDGAVVLKKEPPPFLPRVKVAFTYAVFHGLPLKSADA